MKIALIYTSQLKEALGLGHEEVDLPGPLTVGQLLEHLSELHGQVIEQFLWKSSGEVRPSILICIGDNCVGQDLTAMVNPGDSVTLLSPISGG